jgi:hypothetical protein
MHQDIFKQNVSFRLGRDWFGEEICICFRGKQYFQFPINNVMVLLKCEGFIQDPLAFFATWILSVSLLTFF